MCLVTSVAAQIIRHKKQSPSTQEMEMPEKSEAKANPLHVGRSPHQPDILIQIFQPSLEAN